MSTFLVTVISESKETLQKEFYTSSAEEAQELAEADDDWSATNGWTCEAEDVDVYVSSVEELD